MDPRSIAGQYYDAWQHRAGDMTDVPLAKNFTFTGPVADFDSADGYREMARQAGAAVRRFRVRRQFVDGDVVCSIIDWEMDPLPGKTLTSAELLHIHDGEIVKGELIYDAEDLRRVMAQMAGVVPLLGRSYDITAELIGQISADRWARPFASRMESLKFSMPRLSRVTPCSRSAASFVRPLFKAALTPPTVDSTSSAISSSE